MRCRSSIVNSGVFM